MAKFRKKPVVIDAHRYWFGMVKMPDGVCCCNGDPDHIHTLEGRHIVSDGDWVITGVKGEQYACKPDVFALTYEPAE